MDQLPFLSLLCGDGGDECKSMHEVTFLERVALGWNFSVMTIDGSDCWNSQDESAPFRFNGELFGPTIANGVS
jgi:hypothetical protein